MLVLAEGQITKLYGIEEGDTRLPKGETVVGKKGVYRVGSSDIFNIVKPAAIIWNGFKDIQLKADMTKKIPWSTFWSGPSWIKKRWATNKIEYALILMYHMKNAVFSWACPKQTGSGGSVEFSVADDHDICQMIADGWAIAGSIHNHFGCKGSAFQSGTDQHDEQKAGSAGVHFTMGWMDAPSLYDTEFHVRIVDGEFSKTIKIDDCVEPQPGFDHPEEWMEKLAKATTTYAGYKYKNKHNATVTYGPGYAASKTDTSSENGWSESRGGRRYTGAPYYGQSFDSGPSSITESFAVRKNRLKQARKNRSRIKELSDKMGKEEDLQLGGTKVTDWNPASEDYEILGDMTCLEDAPEDHPDYDRVLSTYPKVASLASGKELLRSIAMVKTILDGTMYAMMDEGMAGHERTMALEEIIDEIGKASASVISHIKVFLDDQEERIDSIPTGELATNLQQKLLEEFGSETEMIAEQEVTLLNEVKSELAKITGGEIAEDDDGIVFETTDGDEAIIMESEDLLVPLPQEMR